MSTTTITQLYSLNDLAKEGILEAPKMLIRFPIALDSDGFKSVLRFAAWDAIEELEEKGEGFVRIYLTGPADSHGNMIMIHKVEACYVPDRF